MRIMQDKDKQNELSEVIPALGFLGDIRVIPTTCADEGVGTNFRLLSGQ